ncbi:MAG: PorT family protein [Chitinophagaceae bacterium]|nr:PorT family protein [Chitinophagaceae bacterium]
MKKLALVLTVFTATVFGAKAQIQFGIKAGANFANVSNTPGSKTLVSFNGGALVKIPLVDALSLQPEVVYSGQGAKFDGGKITLGYVNIPVLAKYTLPVGVFFETGPQLGILLSAKQKVDGGSDTDIKSSLKSTDIAWAFGAGYVIPDINLGVDVRYNLGLTNVIKDGGSSKNGVFQVGVFYLFGEGSKK